MRTAFSEVETFSTTKLCKHMQPIAIMHSLTPLIPKLIHKPLMKLRNLPHPLRTRRQERRAEMLRALSLPEAGAGNNADAGRVQEAEAVEFVGLAAFLLGLLDGFLGERDGGEEVH